MREALDSVISGFREVLDLPDPSQIQTILGVIAANRISDAPPVWLIFVGPPSSGKSAPLKYFRGLPEMFYASEVTPAGLLSCSPKKGKGSMATGGLLTSIGKFGILMISDLSPTLSLADERLGQFISMMREVYDGKVVRYGGQDGGMTRAWDGKIGLIAAATGEIDRHHSVINSLGDRYLYFRMPETDVEAKFNMARKRPAYSESLASSISSFLSKLSEQSAPEISAEHDGIIRNLARFVSVARTAVARDNFTREVEWLSSPEVPVRLYIQLSTLLTGMMMAGLGPDTSIGLVSKVALDSIPPIRLAVLCRVIESDGPVTFRGIEEMAAPFSETSLRRALEDLSSHKVITRTGQNGTSYLYSRSDWLSERVSGLPVGTFSVILSSYWSKEEKGC